LRDASTGYDSAVSRKAYFLHTHAGFDTLHNSQVITSAPGVAPPWSNEEGREIALSHQVGLPDRD
jgi:hypothetical protein